MPVGPTRRRIVFAAPLVALVIGGCAGGTAKPRAPEAGRVAVGPGAKVGALFLTGLKGLHVCTASVVHSATGNVIATAAHCISGTGVGVVFAPGYAAGAAPFGTWTVIGAYANPAWVQQKDPRADVVFLRVAPSPGNEQGSEPVERVVGASTVSVAPVDGTSVTATGYALGSGDSPLTCSAATRTTGGFPTLPCGPLPAGTSGAPWITAASATGSHAELVGVTGGLHQGGCTADVSYSAPFGADTSDLLARAVAGGPADALPNVFGQDGC